jgi:hypothetical protein
LYFSGMVRGVVVVAHDTIIKRSTKTKETFIITFIFPSPFR